MEQDIFPADLLKEIFVHIKCFWRLWCIRFFFQMIEAFHAVHFHEKGKVKRTAYGKNILLLDLQFLF